MLTTLGDTIDPVRCGMNISSYLDVLGTASSHSALFYLCAHEYLMCGRMSHRIHDEEGSQGECHQNSQYHRREQLKPNTS